MKYRVSYEPEALNDLVELYDYIAERGEPVAAFRYIERIRTSCESLATFPIRGSSVADIRNGLRIIGFERRV